MSLSPPPSASTPSSYAPTAPTATSSSTTYPTSSTTADPSNSTSPPTYQFPPIASFPPFYTLQPTLSTRTSQLQSWSSLLLSHASHHRYYTLLPTSPLFTNSTLRRKLPPSDAREILRYLVSQNSASWVSTLSPLPARKGKEEGEEVYLWWRSPEEWARLMGSWVEETGQKGVVLTFYELLEGEASEGKEWRGLPTEMAKWALKGWERRGRCVLVGDGGVKFV